MKIFFSTLLIIIPFLAFTQDLAEMTEFTEVVRIVKYEDILEGEDKESFLRLTKGLKKHFRWTEGGISYPMFYDSLTDKIYVYKQKNLIEI